MSFAAETLTPEQFVTKYLPVLKAHGDAETPTDYFIRNLDTGKLELHITKPTYSAYSDDDKQFIWDSFRWSRNNGCWISRGLPYEDLDHLAHVAGTVGLTDGGWFVTLHVDDAITREENKPEEQEENVNPPRSQREITPQETRTKDNPPERAIVSKPIDSSEIEHALRHGSGFADGKIRIAAFYAHDHTPDEAKQFLKTEYGTGGRSHTCVDGVHGFIDFDAKGFRIRRGMYSDKNGTEASLSWVAVHTYLRDMIRKGTYLTDEEQARFKAVIAPYHGKVPTPKPRMKYPPVKQGT